MVETKKATENQESKNAFIIGPIGPDNSDIRRRIDGLLIEVFRPILNEFGYHAVASHEESKTGSITLQIVDHLLSDDLVVCDLTQHNPNVMYELAVRHFINKPVITVAEEGTKIPFDIGQDRVLLFINDTFGIHHFKKNFRKVMTGIETEQKYDNPISRAFNYQHFLKQDDKMPSGEDKIEFVIEKIKSIEEKLQDSSIMSNNLASAFAIARAKRDIKEHFTSEYEYEIVYEADRNFQEKIQKELITSGIKILKSSLTNEGLIRTEFSAPNMNQASVLTNLPIILSNKFGAKIKYLAPIN